MKKLGLIFFVLLLSCGVSFANEEVWLDINTPDISRFNTGKLQYENQKLDYDEEEENYLKPSFHTMKKMFDEDFYESKKVTTPKEKNFGKTTLDTKLDTKL